MTRFLHPEDWKEVARLYKEELLSCEEISKKYNVSRQAIWKGLNKNNVNTQKGIATQITVCCEFCRATFTSTRKKIRSYAHHFCSQDCHLNWIRKNGENYNQNRYGQMIARMKMENLYGKKPLPKGSIVHHIDGNCVNNDPKNLMLFSSQSDHLKYHRKIGGIVPLWVYGDRKK